MKPDGYVIEVTASPGTRGKAVSSFKIGPPELDISGNNIKISDKFGRKTEPN